MRQEAPFFEDKEPTLIYIAKKLKEALRLESLLTDAGVDYGVEADEYRGGFIFMTTRVGAFFYVLPDAAQAAGELMQCNRFRPYIDPAPQQVDDADVGQLQLAHFFRHGQLTNVRVI